MVLGVVLGGLGVLLVNTQATMMAPLSVGLLQARITTVEVIRSALTLAGIATLALAGASLLPYFALQIVVGLAVLALTPRLLGSARGLRPRFDRRIALTLLRVAAPVGLALAMNILYLRLLVVLVSLTTDADRDGSLRDGVPRRRALHRAAADDHRHRASAACRRRHGGPGPAALRPAGADGGRRGHDARSVARALDAGQAGVASARRRRLRRRRADAPDPGVGARPALGRQHPRNRAPLARPPACDRHRERDCRAGRAVGRAAPDRRLRGRGGRDRRRRRRDGAPARTRGLPPRSAARRLSVAAVPVAPSACTGSRLGDAPCAASRSGRRGSGPGCVRARCTRDAGRPAEVLLALRGRAPGDA